MTTFHTVRRVSSGSCAVFMLRVVRPSSWVGRQVAVGCGDVGDDVDRGEPEPVDQLVERLFRFVIVSGVDEDLPGAEVWA